MSKSLLTLSLLTLTLCVHAPRRAKLKPTTLCDRPVKVSGVNTYNFVSQ